MLSSRRLGALLLGALVLGALVLGPGALLPAAEAQAATTQRPRTHAEEIVRFLSWDGDLTGGPATELQARLMHPAGHGPFPAVVLLHGCSGLFTPSGGLAPRHLWWAMELRDQGYLVLLVDSFGPRGVAEQCTLKERPARASRERARDAWAAFDYLSRRPDVHSDRIALMGWSQGGGAVLASYAEGGPGEGYRGGIAFYPSCQGRLNDDQWRPAGPTLVLIGEKDNWTPPRSCVELAARDAIKERLDLVLYPNAHHGFDLPDSPLRTREGLASPPSGRATVGTDEAARADALARVTDFLAKILKAREG